MGGCSKPTWEIVRMYIHHTQMTFSKQGFQRPPHYPPNPPFPISEAKLNLIFIRRSPRLAVAVVARRTIAARPMATRSNLSPVEQFIAENIHPAPGARTAISSLWQRWKRSAALTGADTGACADLVAAVRRSYPEARRVKARSGRDVHSSDHLTGLALR